MRTLFAKYLSIFAVLSFEAWLLWPRSGGWAFEWEPLIGMMLTLGAYLRLEAKEYSDTEDQRREPSVSQPPAADLALYNEFAELFPAGDIAFFRDHDFRNSFSPEQPNRLFRYVDQWTTVEHEFIDPDLQSHHAEFREKAVDLSTVLAQYTTTNNRGVATVAPSNHTGGPWPQWAKQQADELNQRAAEFVESHQEFLVSAAESTSYKLCGSNASMSSTVSARGNILNTRCR